jgi:hypothetical protein
MPWRRGFFVLGAPLRQQLFIFRHLWAWLNHPLQGPPAAKQLCEHAKGQIFFETF